MTKKRLADPCVSVIIPVYNASNYLVACLSSVLAKHFKVSRLSASMMVQQTGVWRYFRILEKGTRGYKFYKENMKECPVPEMRGLTRHGENSFSS